MRRVVLLVVSGVLLGVVLTGGAGALPGSQDLNALTWLSSVATVAALVVAVGIFRVQQSQNDVAHQELLDVLKAQDEILQDLAEATSSDASSPAPATEDDPLTAAQHEALEAQYGDRSIVSTLAPRNKRGNRARLVRLEDGTLVAVSEGRGGGVRLRQLPSRRDGGRQSRDRRSRGPQSS